MEEKFEGRSPKSDRRQDMQLGRERARALEDEDKDKGGPDRRRVGIRMDEKSMQDGLHVQGLIEQFRNPTVTEDEKKTLNSNKQVDAKLGRQVEAAQQLQMLASSNSLDPEVSKLAQDAVAQYNMTEHLKVVGFTDSLWKLGEVSQAYSKGPRSRFKDGAETNLRQDFDKGLKEVATANPELGDTCARLGEYLPVYQQVMSKNPVTESEKFGKMSAKTVKVSDGLVAVNNSEIKDRDGHVLCKPELNDDPRTMGNIAGEIKRLLLDPDGTNDKDRKIGHQGLANHKSKLVRDTHKVALDSMAAVNPERYKNLKAMASPGKDISF
jgi:hypothetical protein